MHPRPSCMEWLNLTATLTSARYFFQQSHISRIWWWYINKRVHLRDNRYITAVLTHMCNIKIKKENLPRSQAIVRKNQIIKLCNKEWKWKHDSIINMGNASEAVRKIDMVFPSCIELEWTTSIATNWCRTQTINGIICMKCVVHNNFDEYSIYVAKGGNENKETNLYGTALRERSPRNNSRRCKG